MLCNKGSGGAAANAEFNEFDANLELAGDGFDDFDAALQQQINPRPSGASAPAAAAAGMMPTAGLMTRDDDDLSAGAPLAGGQGAEPEKTGIDKLIEVNQHLCTLLAHFVSNNVQDAHQRTLKAISSGSNTITHEVNVFVQGSFRAWANDPSKAVFEIPEGAFPHTKGTILEATVLDGGSSASASLMLHSGTIKNHVQPTVVSRNAKGVCLFPAKSKTIQQTPIITSSESDFSRDFKSQWPTYTAENLMADAVQNPIKDKKGAVITTKWMFDENHPVATLIITKLKAKGINHNHQWSDLNKKFTFDEDEVKIAANELRKKLTVEDTAVDLDSIRFPLTRAIVSKAAANDRSMHAIKNRWLDTEEMTAHVKSGTLENELEKNFSAWAKIRVMYSPSPDSERKDVSVSATTTK